MTEARTTDEKRVIKQLRLMIDSDDPSLIDAWEQRVREALEGLGKVTTTGRNYLVIEPSKARGEIINPDDYDPETRDFKPGKVPPAWAQTQAARERIAREHKLGPHRLLADGTKVPVDPAPSYGTTRRADTTTQVVEDDDEMVDLDELMKSEDSAKTAAQSVASDAARKFRIKKKGK